MQSDLVRRAMSLPVEQKKRVLLSLKETELHKSLKALFEKMDPRSVVEITHGPDEYGKDLVLVRTDNFGRTVVAVVVQIGDIRGKTLGNLDKIKSQIQQALAHPAKLRSFAEPLRVSEVWVVLAGNISNNAHNRLEAEVGLSRIYDIAWLVDNFSKYYPQVFFEGRASDFLQRKIQELETSESFGSRKLNLSEYFVEPLVAVVDIPVSFEEEDFAPVFRERKVPFSFLTSLVARHKRIVLSGDPGVGKSVALKKLTVDMLRKAYKKTVQGTAPKGIQVPILTSATDLLKYGDITSLVSDYFQSPETAERFRPGALFVDALDEVHPDLRKEAIRKASEFASEVGCSLIITSRKIDLVKSAPSGFEKYELLPFEFTQAMKLLGKLISDTTVLQSLREGLDKIRFHITLTPLSLYLLLEIAEAHGEIPASIVELYDRYCDIALGRYDKDKGIEVLFDYIIKKKFLAALAYHRFFRENRLTITRHDFQSFLKGYAKEYGWTEQQLNDFSYEIERSGALDLQDDQEVGFRHRSFLDYFTAFHIVENREIFEHVDNMVADVYFDDVWSDVALFYVGLRRDIRQTVLDKIFGYEGNGIVVRINKLLVGRLLQAAWHTTQKNKLDGVSKSSYYMLPIRRSFLSIAREADGNFPEVLADWFVVTLAEYAYGSAVLEHAVREVFNRLSLTSSFEAVYRMAALLWAIQRFLEETELRKSVDKILETVSRVSLSPKEESLILLLLTTLERKDKSLARVLRKRLRRLSRAHPRLFKELLPQKHTRRARARR